MVTMFAAGPAAAILAGAPAAIARARPLRPAVLTVRRGARRTVETMARNAPGAVSSRRDARRV